MALILKVEPNLHLIALPTFVENILKFYSFVCVSINLPADGDIGINHFCCSWQHETISFTGMITLLLFFFFAAQFQPY